MGFVQQRACRANGTSCGDGEVEKGARVAFVSDGNHLSHALLRSR